MAASPVIDFLPFEEFYSHKFSRLERLRALSRANVQQRQRQVERQTCMVEIRIPSRRAPMAEREAMAAWHVLKLMTSRAKK